MSWPRLSEPSRLALKYAFLAGVWIIASDSILSALHADNMPPVALNILKGLGFVAVTCVVLHLLASRMQRRLRETEDARQNDLRQANARLQRAKGMHAALVRANQAALTATEPDALCREISEAMVGLAGLRLVWFARVNELTRQIEPCNWAGDAKEYMTGLRCSVDPNDPYGQGPTGRCIRESTTMICRDMLVDPSLEPWREQIKRHGFRSSLCMPLRFAEGRGSMAAYAGEPDFFDHEIVELMHRLVADLEHGLGLITTRAERAIFEQNLRENEARHRALFDSHHVAMLLIDPREARVVDATPAAARILGTPLKALKKQSLRESLVWTSHGLLETAERAFKHDQPASIHTTLPSPDGGELQIAATFSPFPFRDDIRLLCTIEDVTEKHRAIEQLKLMRTVAEAAPSGIVVADVLGRIEWVNPAFTTMTGYTLEQITGRTPDLLKSGRQSPAFYEQMWNTISRGKIWEGDLQNQRRDGSIYWEHMIIAPVMRPNGTIEHYVAIKQDISAQKDMESQVARTQRLESIGLLAGGIAHDLNNVLAPILMAMDLFKLRYPEPADQARFEMVRKSAERGAGIVRQVLTFARGVGGERMSLRPEHLIKEVRNLLQETLPRSIEIMVDIEEKLPSIVGDPTQLHQVLLNLGVNARDAMPGGGTLTIGAEARSFRRPCITRSGLAVPPGDYVALSVTDTGTGIEPEIMERMFEPFFTTKERGAGTGLGLSTVIGIVRGHGGGLDVASKLGKGTTFRVLLPADANSRNIFSHPARPAEIAGAGRVILIVDDEEPVRAVTGMALDLKGFAHVDAADGREALKIFEREPDRFAAVILDHMMPRLGGTEVAARIKTLRPSLPVVLISGLLADDSKPDHTAAGDAVLRKPFAPEDLYAALARAFAASGN